MSLVALPDGNLLCGTTVAAGTGGEVKASLAELFMLDMETKQITWQEPLLADARNYTDMYISPDGLVYGIVYSTRMFVFDPATSELVQEVGLEEEFGRTAYGQGPRIFIDGPDGRVFMLFQKGIAELDLETHAITMLVESPIAITTGGDYLDGRVYFGHGSHVYSWTLPAAE